MAASSCFQAFSGFSTYIHFFTLSYRWLWFQSVCKSSFFLIEELQSTVCYRVSTSDKMNHQDFCSGLGHGVHSYLLPILLLVIRPGSWKLNLPLVSGSKNPRFGHRNKGESAMGELSLGKGPRRRPRHVWIACFQVRSSRSMGPSTNRICIHIYIYMYKYKI